MGTRLKLVFVLFFVAGFVNGLSNYKENFKLIAMHYHPILLGKVSL